MPTATIPKEPHHGAKFRGREKCDALLQNTGRCRIAAVGEAIVGAGFEAGVQSRLCWTFTGDCDMTLYPSGKLMVRTEDAELAAHVAQQHITLWVHA